MTDLLGDEMQSGARTMPHRGFAEFWAAYPAGPRKVAKQQCLNKWALYGCANSATLIAQHVEWMKTQRDWVKDGGAFICGPLPYLNQQRWIDWTPPVAKPEQEWDAALKKIAADRKLAVPCPPHLKRSRL